MTDIERDHQFDSDDERVVDPDLDDDEVLADVHRDPEAPEADTIDQHREVHLDDADDVAL